MSWLDGLIPGATTAARTATAPPPAAVPHIAPTAPGQVSNWMHGLVHTTDEQDRLAALRQQQLQAEQQQQSKQGWLAAAMSLASPLSAPLAVNVSPDAISQGAREATSGAFDVLKQGLANAVMTGIEEPQTNLGPRARAMMMAQGRDPNSVQDVAPQQQTQGWIPTLNNLIGWGVDREDPAAQRQRLLAEQAGMNPSLAGQRSLALQAGAIPNAPRQAANPTARMLQEMLSNEAQRRATGPIAETVQGSEAKPPTVEEMMKERGFTPGAALMMDALSNPLNLVFEGANAGSAIERRLAQGAEKRAAELAAKAPTQFLTTDADRTLQALSGIQGRQAEAGAARQKLFERLMQSAESKGYDTSGITMPTNDRDQRNMVPWFQEQMKGRRIEPKIAARLSPETQAKLYERRGLPVPNDVQEALKSYAPPVEPVGMKPEMARQLSQDTIQKLQQRRAAKAVESVAKPSVVPEKAPTIAQVQEADAAAAEKAAQVAEQTPPVPAEAPPVAAKVAEQAPPVAEPAATVEAPTTPNPTTIHDAAPSDIDRRTVKTPTASGVSIGIGKDNKGFWRVWDETGFNVKGSKKDAVGAIKQFLAARGEELKRQAGQRSAQPGGAMVEKTAKAVEATPGSDKALVKGFLDQKVRGGVAQAADGNIQFSHGVNSYNAPVNQAAGIRPVVPGGTSVDVGAVQSPHETLRQTARKLTRLVFGGDKTLGKAAGYYNKSANIAAVRKAYNLPDAFHEIGHAIEHRHGLIQRLSPQGQAELHNLVQNANKYHPSQLADEGVAEAVRLFIHDPAQLDNVAPSVAAELENIVRSDPDVRSVLGEAADRVAEYRHTSPQERLQSVVVDSSKPKGANQGGPSAADKMIDGAFDNLVHIERAQEKVLGAKPRISDDVYKQSRMQRAIANEGLESALRGEGVPTVKRRADGTIERGHTGESLEKVLSGLDSEEKVTDFQDYLIARRAQELGNGKTPVALADASSVITEMEQKYGADIQRRAKAFYKWHDQVLQYAVDSGLVSKEGAAKMRETALNYAPMRRQTDIGIDEFAAEQFRETNRGLEAGKPGSLMRLNGSHREIVTPLMTSIANAHAIMMNGEKNLVGQTMARLIDTHAPEVGEAFGRNVTQHVYKRFPGGKGAMIPTDGGMPNTVRVMIDGKPQFYQLKPEVFKSWKSLSPEEAGSLAKWGAKASQVVRAGVTWNPKFWYNEFIRNPVEYAVSGGDVVKMVHNYGVPALPLLNEPMVRGTASYLLSAMEHSGIDKSTFGKMAKHVLSWFGSADAVQFYKQYGGKAGLNASLKSEAQYGQELADVLKGFTPREMQNTWLPKGMSGKVRQARRFFSHLKEGTEDLARVGVYEARYRQGVKAGEGLHEARANSAFEARDVLDFGQKGSAMKDLAMIQAFTRPKLTGTHRFYRSMKRDPMGTMVRGLSSLTLPAAALYYMTRDDADYAEIPEPEKNYFYHLRIGDGPKDFLRIAKPPGIATVYFDEMTRRILNHVDKHDPQAFDGAMKSIVENQTPFTISKNAPYLTPKLGSIADAYAILRDNYDPFYDSPVLAPYEQEKLPSEAVSDKTPSLSVKLASLPGDAAERLGADRRQYDLAPKQVDRAVQAVAPGVFYEAYRRVGGTPPGVSNSVSDFVGATKHDFSSDTLNKLYKRQIFLRQAQKSDALTPDEETELGNIEQTMTTVKDLKAQLQTASDKTQRDRIIREIFSAVEPFRHRVK